MQETAGGAPEEVELSAFEDSPNERDIDVLEISLCIAASRERVFALLTDPDRIELWFAQVSGVEPHPGGAVEFVFFNENGTVSVFSGEVTDFVANRKFGFTWHNRQWTFPPLHVLITLKDVGGSTVLLLRQTGFTAAPPLEREIHDEGWWRYLERLAAVADGTRPAGWNA